MSGKTALPVALLVVVFLAVSPTVKALAQNTCPGCSEPAKVVHPNGFGPQSYARWQPKTGLADSSGTNAFSMLLVHSTPPTITATARAVVAIEGFDGEAVGLSGVSGLSFFVRTTDPKGNPTPNECNLTTMLGPRFSIRWLDPILGDNQTFFHCGNLIEMPAVGTPTTAPNGSTYQQHVVNQALMFTLVPPTAIILSLAILWDDPGSSHIDNISVSDANVGCAPCTWTGPADNGGN